MHLHSPTHKHHARKHAARGRSTSTTIVLISYWTVCPIKINPSSLYHLWWTKMGKGRILSPQQLPALSDTMLQVPPIPTTKMILTATTAQSNCSDWGWRLQDLSQESWTNWLHCTQCSRVNGSNIRICRSGIRSIMSGKQRWRIWPCMGLRRWYTTSGEKDKCIHELKEKLGLIKLELKERITTNEEHVTMQYYEEYRERRRRERSKKIVSLTKEVAGLTEKCFETEYAFQ